MIAQKFSDNFDSPKPLSENIKFFIKVLTGDQNWIQLNFQDFEEFLDFQILKLNN